MTYTQKLIAITESLTTDKVLSLLRLNGKATVIRAQSKMR